MVVKGNRYLPRVLCEGFNGFAQCLVRCELLLEGTALEVVAADNLRFEIRLDMRTETAEVGGEVVGLEFGFEGIELSLCVGIAALKMSQLAHLCQRRCRASVIGEVAGGDSALEVGVVGIGDVEEAGLGNLGMTCDVVGDEVEIDIGSGEVIDHRGQGIYSEDGIGLYSAAIANRAPEARTELACQAVG